MIINHIIVHLHETKKLVEMLQTQIQKNPRRGFWILSAVTFIVAPFLTNDGVCLLFVEIILKAFEGIDEKPKNTSSMVLDTCEEKDSVENPLSLENPLTQENPGSHSRSHSRNSQGEDAIAQADKLETGNTKKLEIPNSDHISNVFHKKNLLVKEDALYFLLTLACSSNIGSALTYTGNPQNMIVAQGAADVLPPYKFLLWMILPTIITWLLTTSWIDWCWSSSKVSSCFSLQHIFKRKIRVRFANNSVPTSDDGSSGKLLQRPNHNREPSGVTPDCPFSVEVVSAQEKVASPMSPRRKARMEREAMITKVHNIISSPIPYIAILLVIAMIVMIFVDIISITSLVCVTAMLMITVLVFSNHWRGISIWGLVPNSEQASMPLTATDRLDDLNEFFEELFNSIDYSILMIFLGTFVVIANLESTGIPKRLWDNIVGN